MVSGSAPGRLANTTMVGISTDGNAETGRKREATIPDSRMPSASRMVATGRVMKKVMTVRALAWGGELRSASTRAAKRRG